MVEAHRCTVNAHMGLGMRLGTYRIFTHTHTHTHTYPQEVHPRSPLSEQKVKVLQNYALLAAKGRQSAELALGKFTEMVTTEVGGAIS